MKKILTLIAIAIIFTTSFTNASTVAKVNDTKTNLSTPKTPKNTKSFVKISAKDFSLKKMQDIK